MQQIHLNSYNKTISTIQCHDDESSVEQFDTYLQHKSTISSLAWNVTMSVCYMLALLLCYPVYSAYRRTHWDLVISVVCTTWFLDWNVHKRLKVGFFGLHDVQKLLVARVFLYVRLFNTVTSQFRMFVEIWHIQTVHFLHTNQQIHSAIQFHC